MRALSVEGVTTISLGFMQAARGYHIISSFIILEYSLVLLLVEYYLLRVSKCDGVKRTIVNVG